jgi:filamentous hemagglutinin family protein
MKHHSVIATIDAAAVPARIKPLVAAIRGAMAGLSLGAAHAVAGELPIPAGVLATMGRADQAVVGNKMTITQHTDRAVLNWQKFNIGKENTVQFKQPGASSIALNRIFQSDPSQILGRLDANGQVYLLNQNGFVFGRDSQVNVNTLVASTLNITDETFERGITKVLEQDGRAALIGTGQVYNRDADGHYVLDESGKKTKIGITFEQGAKVTAQNSGRIIAAAPSVVNRGELKAPDGQIVMVAATDKVYLQETSGNASLRGLVVEVATGGDVSNFGKIAADRGNATLLGFAVNQKGRITASTSINANGSIRLLAREGATVQREGDKWLLQPGSTRRSTAQDDGLGTRATVTLGSGSQTLANPDLKDKAKAVDSQVQEKPLVEIMAQQVHLEKKSTLSARSGSVTLTATENPAVAGGENLKNDSRVTVDRGAVIDVSGIKNVSLPMSRNVATVELRSNELRDAPLQRDGLLYARKVKVDIRKGTPLADITGALDRIARTVAERSTTGGAVNLVSEGQAVINPGSRLNFSGGSVLFRPGYVNTTQLIGPFGRTVDIGEANPDQTYTGIVGKVTQKAKDWSQTESFLRAGPSNGGRYEEGYVEGKSAGSLNIKAAALALEGEMQAAAVNGIRQRSPEAQAQGGHLTIDLARTPDSAQAVVFGKKYAPVDLQPDAAFPLSAMAPSQPQALTLKGTVLRAAGLQSTDIKTNGRITINQGETVSVRPGGSLSLNGGEIEDAGRINARAGEVKLSTHLTTHDQKLTGAISLGATSAIDASGGWNNDRPAVSTGSNRLDGSRLITEGGSVTVKAEGDVTVAAGSQIDVSGGGQRTSKGKLIAGDAGSITLEAAGLDGSDLAVAGNMAGYALTGGKGGSLSLTSDQVIIGANTAGGASETVKPLVIDPALFKNGGFQHYSLTSNKSGVSVSDGTSVQVTVKNRVLMPGYVNQATGADIRTFSQVALLPRESRPAGQLDLSLAQKVGFGGKNAAVTVGQGARLATDVGGTLNLTSDGSILMNGELSAKAGHVGMTIRTPVGTDPGFLPNQGIWLGSTARVDVAGASLLHADGIDRVTGEVLDGGTISLHADRGFIVADMGSMLDVSGTSAKLDVPVKGPNGGASSVRKDIGSSGGRIELVSAEGVQLYGAMQAQAGKGAGAAGGELAIELNPRTRNEPEVVAGNLAFPKDDSVIRVSQSAGIEPAPAQASDIPKAGYGQALISADQVSQGGFSSLALKTPDRIEFAGPVTLATERSMRLDAPVLAYKPAADAQDGSVGLSSAYVNLGSSQTRPGAVTPVAGTAALSVQAGLLDMTGSSALQGFGTSTLTSGSDIRLVGIRTDNVQRDFLGEFLAAGDLTLNANQIYPSTLSNFRIAVQGKPDSTLSIGQGSQAGSPVLSAAGTLTLEAPNIVQAGTIKAPLGEVSLKASNLLELASGSVTSNSAEGAVIPFGRTQGGIDWIYPLGNQNLILTAPPEKKLVLEGKTVNLASGSVIDTRGGGDLSAFEFIPGPGGSYNIFDPASKGYQGSYAVLPNFSGTAAPSDPLELPASGLKVGDSVYLEAAGGLKAGRYTLLPATYALLPGAYLLTPQSGTTDLLPGQKVKRSDGASIAAGYRTVAGTDIRDPRWSGFVVETGAAARKRAEFSVNLANSFFTRKAGELDVTVPYLPNDAGSMVISAQTGLNLDGQVMSTPAANGRGGRLDIAADNIAVVSQAQTDAAVAGAVNLIAENLNGLGVASISLGGIRTIDGNTITQAVKASTVRLTQNAKLTGEEIILAAKRDIALASGAEVTATGAKTTAEEPQVYKVEGDAAILRAASSGQIDLQRSNVQGVSGSITIGTGAKVASTGSMMVDATAENQLNGSLETQGGSVALGAKRISLGATDASASGLILSPAILGSLNADELILSSGSDISLFGAATVSAQSMILRSAGVLGFANDGQTASLTADTLRLENTNGARTALSASGQGQLSMTAKTLTLGAGAYQLAGFSSANVAASERVNGAGAGTLTAASNLAFTTPLVTAGRSANTVIDATGHSVTIESSGPATLPAVEALGARLAITADSIRQASTVSLASGGVSLNALKGDLDLAAGSSIDVSGRSVSIGNSVTATAGGTIDLSALAGNVNLSQGASLKLSGIQAGSLGVTVPRGAFNYAGSVDATGSQQGGRFVLDVGSANSGDSLATLARKLTPAGFSRQIDLTARSGDWYLASGDTLAAQQVAIAAENGGIRIEGAITAKGADADVRLKAADTLALGSTALIQAEGTAAAGGSVTLDGVDSNTNNLGGIDLAAGARIDVRANDGSSNGEVALRADRVGQDVAVSGDLPAVVSGATTTVEAVRSYTKSGTITAANITNWKADTDAYMANAGAIESRLGLPGGLRAGLAIKSSGDLTLDSTGWDLVDWRYGGRTGVLTLSAARDLSIGGNLSDGFRDETQGIDLGKGQYAAIKDKLQADASWSFNLAAGRNLDVGADRMVRTGTGDIAVSAGQDVMLGNSAAAIYTAGQTTDSQRYGSFKPGFVASRFYGEYPINGGDISISAGRDVNGAKTGQFFDGWLVRTGNWIPSGNHTGQTPTAWAVAVGGVASGTSTPAGFHQNIGALGGGNVRVNAARDVNDLSVIIATTGKQVGEVADPNDAANFNFNTNVVNVAGGGRLAVTAGSDVVGGTFYNGKGEAEISAGGSLRAGSAETDNGPVLALGDSRFSLKAGDGIQLGAAINPTVINNSRSRNYFFTYTADSGLNLEALSGTIELQNNTGGMIDAVNALRARNNQIRFPGVSQDALTVYPASLTVAALQGDIRLDRSLTTYPSATAAMSFRAGGNIGSGSFDNGVNVTQSDADPVLLPGVINPATTWDDASLRLQPSGDANLIHAKTPVHRNDPNPAEVYANGDIKATDPLLFSLAKSVNVMAGNDLKDVSFQIQHPSYSLSSLSAGRDIAFSSPRNIQGNLINVTRQVSLAGPGQLWVTAGRTVDLGASEGIYTTGNTGNSALAADGASITVMPGLGKQEPQFDAFARKYDPFSDQYGKTQNPGADTSTGSLAANEVSPTAGSTDPKVQKYGPSLISYMRTLTGDAALDLEGAVAAYQALPAIQRRGFQLGLLFDEIRMASTKAAKSGRLADYDGGYQAIDTLFPGAGSKASNYAGDLKLFFSKIQTLGGGDINMLVPGGYVNAGLASAFAGSKDASDLGIVAQRDGDINSVINGNFMVNQSRVFSLGGGNITLWSSNGNIDAGQGAKAAIAVPPPLVSFDAQGNLKVEFPPAVSGSGIRTASSAGTRAGDVYLAAPKGIVDAGEAGIGGSNVTIAATAVVGAGNISVSGTSTGVPAAPVAVPVSAGASAAASAATNTATQTAQDNTNNATNQAKEKDNLAQNKLNPLAVDILGFGECGVADVRDGKPGCV